MSASRPDRRVPAGKERGASQPARIASRARCGWTRLLPILAFGCVLDLGAAAGAHAADVAPDELTPILVASIAAPIPVLQSDGRWKVAYELELTNVVDAPMKIESVEVRSTTADAIVKSLAGDELAHNLVVPGGTNPGTLGPGQAGVLFVNLAFDGRDRIPAGLIHRITAVSTAERPGLPQRLVENVGGVAVSHSPPVVIGAPLRGDRWVAGASCCDSYHRRAALPVNGRRFVAQRFAIDWVQLDPENRLATGDPKRNESYPQFGADVIAVADAKVAHVRDGLPERTPGAMPTDTTLENADGNSIVLDLGNGRFALYAHLQPGSLRVRAGDHVKRGQLLAQAGNSGNTDAPHLHFHVMDGPSPLASNGLPYVIDAFEVTGHVVSKDDLETDLKNAEKPLEVTPEANSRRTNELPADLALVRFGR